MTNSNFIFVKDKILRKNLDITFNHIVNLIPLTEAENYDEEAKSLFRKTAIIHTASIVEALLFYYLNSIFSDKEVDEYYAQWELKNKKVLYHVSGNHEIVAGDYKKVTKKGRKEKLNLAQIAGFLKDKSKISEKLFEEIDEIRILRNKQHLNTQTEVKEYSKADLETAFSIARNVKKFVKARLNKSS